MQNTVAIVRYFELSVMIAKISALAFEKIAKNAINQVLQNFFDFDILTQLALMDFFTQFDAIPWAGNIVGPFLAQLFKNLRDGRDSYGLVQSNVMVLASSVYAQDPSQFNVFENDDFLWFLSKYCSSSQENE